jgi:hypothetical protein
MVLTIVGVVVVALATTVLTLTCAWGFTTLLFTLMGLLVGLGAAKWKQFSSR